MPIVCDAEALSAGVKAQIRDYARQAIARLDPADATTRRIRELFENGREIKVYGPGTASVALISDMGLAPAISVRGEDALDFTYAMPMLVITSFNPATGAVGIKVTPGAGNAIVADINTAYVHVYGTARLGEDFSLIPGVGFDFSKYLKQETMGEGILYVTLGTHTFLRVKIEMP